MKPSEAPQVMSSDVQMYVVLEEGTRVAVPVELTYRIADPLAVTAAFRTAEGEITWRFARELLRDGLRGPTGEGDIEVRPSHPSRGMVTITLRSVSGSAVVEASRHDLGAFVAETYDHVPEDYEWMHLDIDKVIHELFAPEM